jgi:uncharacterized protein (DUF1800 family)
MGTTTKEVNTRTQMVVAGLAPYTGAFGKEQITHLLKRTMFGAKKADVDYFTGKTLAATINELLTEPPTLTEAQMPLNDYSATDKPDPDVAAGTTWVRDKQNGGLNGERRRSLKAWWVGSMVNQPRSIFEKMVLFWHNHFATELTPSTATAFFNHIETLRKYALGNFRELTAAITLDPNMLDYLNGNFNVKTAPDENYARELQELFTLGKGPNSGYTEADVKAAARVFTGWSYKQTEITTGKWIWEAVFTSNNHDTASKAFSAFYGNKVITNTANTQAGALKEMNDMLDMIFATNEVALYMSRAIYRFFVYHRIDATIETDVIAPMATLLRQSNYNIKPVLKALFTSEHFFEVGIKAALIKSPIENIVGFFREFEIPLPPNTVVPRTAGGVTYYDIPLYKAYASMVSNLETQGQDIGDPPNVSGWPAYYQEPGYHKNWINTDTFPKRLLYSDKLMLSNGVGLTSGYKLAVDFIKFTDQFGTDASDPNKLIAQVLEILYRVPPTNAMIAYLKTTILLDGQASDYYWTDAWSAYKANPTTANFNIVNTRLQKFYLFIVRNPEYQLA